MRLLARAVGSLKWSVGRDVKRHLSTNPALRKYRYPLSLRCLRALFSWDVAAGWLVIYVIVLAIASTLTIANEVICRSNSCPFVLPTILERTSAGRIFIQESGSYMLGAAVGLLGVLSIAVSLVTIIGQRQNSNAEVRVYYNESLASPLAASSLCLLTILCVQIFWPINFIAHRFGYIGDVLTLQIFLTSIHLLWLIINLACFAHFVRVSLTFGLDDARRIFRKRYVANHVAPIDIRNSLELSALINANAVMGLPDVDGARVHFGGFINSGAPELSTHFAKPMELEDVWLKPLKFALANWRKRVAKESTGIAPGFSAYDALSFRPSFGERLNGRVILCRRSGAIGLNRLERVLIRISFRFKPAR